jgi:hypothetical protein
MYITRAAIMYSNGEIFEGRDYHKINQLARKFGCQGEHINGFTSSTGQFLLPNEAAVIAAIAGQVKSRIEELAPDDLWPTLPID